GDGLKRAVWLRQSWQHRPDLNRVWMLCRAVPGRFSRDRHQSASIGAIATEITRAQSNTSLRSNAVWRSVKLTVFGSSRAQFGQGSTDVQNGRFDASAWH